MKLAVLTEIYNHRIIKHVNNTGKLGALYA